MLEVLDEQVEQAEQQTPPFGKYEEEAIASLILDHPEYFANIGPYLRDNLFSRVEVKYVMQHILNYYEKYNIFPTRALLRDMVTRHLTVDEPYVEDILKIIDRKSDPREIPGLKDRVIEWAKHKAYDILWSEETIKRFNQGDYAYIDQIVEEARRVQEVGGKSLWFFDELEKLFVEEENEHFTTGISPLDPYLNDGGPTKKEMVVWMAPTGVGKSIMLVNNAVANVKKGKKVLYITLELSDWWSAIRTLGALTDRAVDKREKRAVGRDAMLKIARQFRADGAGDLVIHELPPDEVSVDAIYGLLEQLKRDKGWVPDVIIIDYLELMISRRESDNKDGYTRQKAVSTQVRGLAINANVLIFTATQTNRGGNDDTQVIDVTKIAESYGKAMPMDYLISINQTEDEYKEGQETKLATARLYIAKNRNGTKFITINVRINYATMKIKEVAP